MSETKRGLFIGRFQPLHLGHLSVIEEMDANPYLEELIVGVGSWQYDYLHVKPDTDVTQNPFTGQERVEMIQRTLQNRIQKKTHVIGIPDIHNYPKWVSHVESLVPEFHIVYSGNTIVKELMEQKGYLVKMVNKIEVSSTTIRNMIANREEKWKTLVPEEVVEYLSEIKGEERIQRLFHDKDKFRCPYPAADIIIKCYDKDSSVCKGIVIVDRKFRPYGYALPGGFIEYGETAENAAAREAFEETSLDIEIERLFGVYSNPRRDARRHTISICYVAHAHGMPKAGDDAESVIVVPHDELADFAVHNGFAFNHKEILLEYLKSEGKL